jgi:hypothetical protein
MTSVKANQEKKKKLSSVGERGVYQRKTPLTKLKLNQIRRTKYTFDPR